MISSTECNFQYGQGTRLLLLQTSAATIDRLLAEERRSLELVSRPRTKLGSLLKRQIPVRTFADWNEQQTGFGLQAEEDVNTYKSDMRM